MKDLRLAAMLCSRLCHDLIGPIGAIGNGVEILGEEPDGPMRDKAIALLADSAKQAGERLKFYRLAFGIAGGDDQSVSLEEARLAAEGFFDEGKVRLQWERMDGAPALSKPAIRLLLNLLLTGSAALVRGGTLAVAIEPTPSADARLVAEGPGARLDEETRAILAGSVPLEQVEPRRVQPYYAARLAAEIGGVIACRDGGDGRIELGARLA